MATITPNVLGLTNNGKDSRIRKSGDDTFMEIYTSGQWQPMFKFSPLVPSLPAIPYPTLAFNWNSNLNSTYPNTSYSFPVDNLASVSGGKFGNCLSLFNYGSDSNIEQALTPISSASGYEFSITYWFTYSGASSAGNNEFRVLLNSNSGDTMCVGRMSDTLVYVQGSGVPFISYFQQNTTFPPSSNSAYWSNKWSFYAMMFDGVDKLEFTLYLHDGTKYTSSATIVTSGSMTKANIVAAIQRCVRTTKATGGLQIMNYVSSDYGRIDHMQLFTTKLTTTQIDAIYAATTDVIV